MQNSDNAELDFATLRVLQSLFETHNTTKTAERLNLSQPTVSRALAKLRLALGDPILVKGPGGLVPSERAEIIRTQLMTVMAMMDAFLTRPTFDPKSASRVFRLSTTDYGALVLLPRLIPLLAKSAPHVAIEILPFSADVFRHLGDGQTDLALYSDDDVPLPLRSRTLFRENYSCLVRKGHPILKGDLGLDNFLAWPHALVSVLGGRAGVVDDALSALGRRRNITMWIPYFATTALVIAKSDMILTVPNRAAEQLKQAGTLVLFPPPLVIEPFDYRLLWHERSHADRGHYWLREAIASSFS